MTKREFLKSVTGALAGAGVTGAASLDVKEVPAGKLYAIEIPGTLRPEWIDVIRHALEPYEERFRCKFLVLDGGATLRDPSAPVVNISFAESPSFDDDVA